MLQQNCLNGKLLIIQKIASVWYLKWSHSVVSDSATPWTVAYQALRSLSVHGIFQARVREWVAISFSRGSSQPRDQTQVSCTAGRRFTIWATRETWKTPRHILIKLTKIKHKEQILKAAREKQQITQGDSYKDNSWSFNRNSSGQEGMARHT